MDGNIKNEAPAETRTSIGELKVTVTFGIDGLKELRELTEALSHFQEKGLMVSYAINS